MDTFCFLILSLSKDEEAVPVARMERSEIRGLRSNTFRKEWKAIPPNQLRPRQGEGVGAVSRGGVLRYERILVRAPTTGSDANHLS